MIGLCFSGVLFIVFVVCYIVSKQYPKKSGSRLTLELSALGSLLFMGLSICVGLSGI